MDDLSKARRKWKRAEDAVEEAQAKLKAAGGTPGQGAAAQARRELEEAEDEERKAKRKYRRLKAGGG